LGERRCEQVISQHGASVLSLRMYRQHVLSGCANGEVRLSHLTSGSSCLLCRAPSSVLSMQVERQRERLWVASVSSTLLSWDLSGLAVPVAGFEDPTLEARAMSAAADPAVAEAPMLQQPMLTIKGSDGIKRHATLRAKLQALTESDRGEVALWDLPTATCLGRFSPPSKGEITNHFDKLLEQDEEEHISVPSWFTLSSRSGQLEVTFEASICFNAEVYAADLCLQPAHSELRINLGERMLAALFAPWRKHADLRGEDGAADAPPSFVLADLSALQLCVVDEGVVVLKCAADALPKEIPERTPSWLLACVLDGQYDVREQQKIAFVLEPHPSSTHMPKLRVSECRLSAPRALKLLKVFQYMAEKLGEQQHARHIELSCCDMPLKADMSLSTVRAFYWKQGGDMILHYNGCGGPEWAKPGRVKECPHDTR